jgi:spore coat polysaccharide biosynthesis protein SpsF
LASIAKVVGIVQARTGSSRLPGKVLKVVCGRTLLEHQMERMLRARSLAEIAIATSIASSDDVIEDLAHSHGWAIYRGAEHDVLARYAAAAAAFGADPIVRMTMDCPLIDPTVIDRVVEAYRDGPYDFVANNLEPTFPHGLDLEVFSRGALEIADREASKAFEREHVSPFIRDRPEQFRLANVAAPRDLHRLRWTVDYPEDLEFVRVVYASLYREGSFFTTEDVLELLDQNPAIGRLNAARAPS